MGLVECIILYCAIAMIVFTFVKIKIAERIKLALSIAIFLATTGYYVYAPSLLLIISEIASIIAIVSCFIAIVSCFKTKKLESSEQNISE